MVDSDNYINRPFSQLITISFLGYIEITSFINLINFHIEDEGCRLNLQTNNEVLDPTIVNFIIKPANKGKIIVVRNLL